MDDLVVLILAAGASSRSAPYDKLHFDIEGQTTLRHVTQTFLDAQIGQVSIVIGGEFAQQRCSALEGLHVKVIDFPNAKLGMGASIAHGVSQLPKSAKSVLIALADMPKIDVELISQLARAHKLGGITAPIYDGQRGHPVIFDRCYFEHLMSLKGDKGASQLIEDNKSNLTLVEDNHGISVFDVDQ